MAIKTTPAPAAARNGNGAKRTSKRLQYATSRESTPANIAASYGHFIGGAFVPSSGGETFETTNPATGDVLSRVATGNQQDVDRAVAAARTAYEKYWQPLSPARRAAYVYRIARAISERARELAVLETLDNGKPIKESRDFDVPLSAAHFFYYAGWADKLAYAARGGRRRHSLGVVGPIVPWNFPLLMAAWKIAPALAAGNTVVLKPAETTPLTALRLAEIFARGRSAARRAQRRHRRRRDGRGARRASRHRQDRVHRFDRGRQGDQRGRAPARACRSPSSWAARRRTSSSPTRRSTRRSKGSSAASTSTRVTSAAPARACCVQECVHDEVVAQLRRACETLRLGDPLDKNTDIGAINSRAQLDTHPASWSRAARTRARSAATPPCALPEQGLLVPADVLHRRRRRRSASRARRSSGRCSRVLTFRTPTRRSRRRTTRATGCAPGCGPTKARRASRMAERTQGRRRLGEHVQQVRPDARRSAATANPDSDVKAVSRDWRPYLEFDR